MTTRRLMVIAAAAAGAAALALLALPWLPGTSANRRGARKPRSTVASRGVTQLGIDAARDALACTSTNRGEAVDASRSACGALRVQRAGGSCTASNCQIELIATLDAATTSIPLALTITLAQSGGTWHATGVQS